MTTPPRTMLRTRAVLKMTGLARTTLYKRIGAGDFPEPVRLGPRSIGFYQDEIERWLETRERGLDSAAGRRLRREPRRKKRPHGRTDGRASA